MKHLFLLLGLSFLLACSLSASDAVTSSTPSSKTYFGSSSEIGAGRIRSFVTYSHELMKANTIRGARPLELGVEFTQSMLQDLPTSESDERWCFNDACLPGHEFILKLPEEAFTLPFQWVMVNWNPNGHGPANVYDLPHFDFHFYIMGQWKRSEIAMGECGLVDCEALQRALLPLPTELAPPGYVNVGAVEPLMGNHLINPTAPEHQGQPFTHTWIYGTFDGRLSFFEPMITRDFLLTKPNSCWPIPQPQKYALPGWYPTNYCIQTGTTSPVMRVVLTDFVWSDGL